jgi:NADH:ubiquinone oxidoreductase subunit 5 (chain L)/Multisubunit Na+/H+ antiporter, MnhA subunit
MGGIMSFIAGLTAFYMFRLYFSIFWGKEHKHHHTPHESGFAMALPLVFLATVTVLAGWIPFGHFVTSDRANYDIHIEWTVAGMSVAIASVSILIAALMYRKESEMPKKLATTFKALYTGALNRFYLDELYLFITKKIIFNNVSRPIAWFDRHIIDATMDGFANTTQWTSAKIKGFQSGQVQQYAYVFLLGTLIIALLAIFI